MYNKPVVPRSTYSDGPVQDRKSVFNLSIIVNLEYLPPMLRNSKTLQGDTDADFWNGCRKYYLKRYA